MPSSAQVRSERLTVSTRPFAGLLLQEALTEPAELALGSSLIATSESTGVAVGSDRDAQAAAEEKGGREWKSVGLALGIVLAGSAVALGVLSLSKSEPERAFASEQPLEAEPRSVLAVDALPLQARSVAAAEPLPAQPRVHPVATASAASLSVHAEPKAEEERAARARSRRVSAAAAARRSGAKTASTLGSSKGEKKSSRKVAEKEDGTPPRPSADECDPPWVINEQNIKIFKAQCVR